ncbi:hypothetical protein MIR68_005133 [Amoeboaphelidium protococcarum]|nr:hypothetical protein MIR68_005133 [Amoeboaphelidium protococcarum]
MQDIDQSIYKYFTSAQPAIRRLNSSGQTGSAGLRASGSLRFISSIQEYESLRSGYGIDSIESLVVALNSSFLQRQMLYDLDSQANVAGMIVVYSNGDVSASQDPSSIYSDASPCAECVQSPQLNTNYVWNPNGRSLLNVQVNKPLFGVNANNTNLIQQIIAGDQHNRAGRYPKVGVEMEAFMFAAHNSATCLRRTESQPQAFCFPLGSQSIIAHKNFSLNAQTIFVTAPLDSRSLFDGMAYGANAYTSSILALVGVSQALSGFNISSTNIVFALFNSESYDLTGSRRFIQDVSSKFCVQNRGDNPICQLPYRNVDQYSKIDLSKVSAIFSLRQISATTNGSSYYVRSTGNASELVDAVLSGASGLNITAKMASSQLLPPSSVAAFLEYNSTMKSAIISDYDSQFIDQNFFSQNDRSLSQSQLESICQISTSVARAVYKVATGVSNSTISANCTVLSQLSDCMLGNFNCTLATQYLNYSSPVSIDRSVGSYFSSRTADLFLLRSILGDYVQTSAGNQTCTLDGDCDLSKSELCINKVCTLTSSYFHPAYGTGLEYDAGRGRFTVVDPSKPSWTVSNFGYTGMRFYQTDSVGAQIGQIFGSLIVCAFTFILCKQYRL